LRQILRSNHRKVLERRPGTILGGIDFYKYVENNPQNAKNPSGQRSAILWVETNCPELMPKEEARRARLMNLTGNFLLSLPQWQAALACRTAVTLLGLIIWGLIVWEIRHLAKYPKKIAPRVIMVLAIVAAFTSQVKLMDRFSLEESKLPNFYYFICIEGGVGLVLLYGTVLVEWRKDKSKANGPSLGNKKG
jgi:hypothetical protein